MQNNEGKLNENKSDEINFFQKDTKESLIDLFQHVISVYNDKLLIAMKNHENPVNSKSICEKLTASLSKPVNETKCPNPHLNPYQGYSRPPLPLPVYQPSPSMFVADDDQHPVQNVNGNRTYRATSRTPANNSHHSLNYRTNINRTINNPSEMERLIITIPEFSGKPDSLQGEAFIAFLDEIRMESTLNDEQYIFNTAMSRCKGDALKAIIVARIRTLDDFYILIRTHFGNDCIPLEIESEMMSLKQMANEKVSQFHLRINLMSQRLITCIEATSYTIADRDAEIRSAKKDTVLAFVRALRPQLLRQMRMTQKPPPAHATQK